MTPSERIAKCFRDALGAIVLIEAWVDESGGAEQAICHDMKTRSAIERQFLIISEAAVRLNKLDPTAAWRQVSTGPDSRHWELHPTHLR